MQMLELGFKGDPEFCSYKDNFFDSRVLEALYQNIINSGKRKREFQLGDIPSDLNILSEAIEYARGQTKINFNTAILKQYNPGEGSGAYDWHIDPDRFFGGPLGICTLKGESELGVRDGKGIQMDIRTIPNRFVLADSKLEHRASPPKNSSGKRSFLFLGVDQ